LGVNVLIPATAPINSPSATLTIAQLADPTPLPGRSSPGFIGGTAIINGTTTGAISTADDVFVEPAENVVIGTITHATCTNADCSNLGDTLAVLNSPLVRLTDARIPAGPPSNAFGFAIDLSQGALVGAVVSAEGYFGQIATVPPPGGVTRFTDVPTTHPFFAQIEAVAAAGITGGCTATTFCPDNPVTRGQMAVFIEASLSVPQPVCNGGVFSDVTVASVGAAMCGFIEDLAAKGITSGCGGGNYCPNDPVSRGQMAVFLETAMGNPANACTQQFTDVTIANPFCGFIERLAQDGITGGCGGTNFCPNDPVTRGQMAVFLVAAPILLPLP
jgi:S-layer homology domain